MPRDYHQELGLDHKLSDDAFVAELHRIRFETEQRTEPEALRRYAVADEALSALAELGRLGDDRTVRRDQLAEVRHGQPPVRPGVRQSMPARPQQRRNRVFSNLNLNGNTPTRIRPRLGEWGPTDMISTREKKRQRWLVPLVCFLILLGVSLLWYYFYTALTGQKFFF